MPFHRRAPFSPIPPPTDLSPMEEVFYLKMTNEVFRHYDDYFDRVILCNSLVWACSLTGKAGLTFEEALDSEKQARKQIKGLPKDLRKIILYLITLTRRCKILDVCEEVFAYCRERYFIGERVLAVIGNLWCPARVLKIIPPTSAEIEEYKQEQIEKGLLENNDYLKDETWGPPPDLFRYEVEELDPDDPNSKVVLVLESIDVKREKTLLTRDKCRIIIKHFTYYSEVERVWKVNEEVNKTYGLNQMAFQDIFIGKAPDFEQTPGSLKAQATPSFNNKGSEKGEKSGRRKKEKEVGTDETPKRRRSKKGEGEKEKEKKPRKSGKKEGKEKNSEEMKSRKRKNKDENEKSPKKKKKAELTPAELKQIEMERKAKEREKLKADRKFLAEFKKLWFKPKEDLEVEDLKDLPTPDPVAFEIPNHLFGDFMMILEYVHCYSNVLKLRDTFSNGLTFELLQNALINTEIAGPFSDIVQLLLKSLFRMQEYEDAETSQENTAAAELDLDGMSGDVSTGDAIGQATAAATWSLMYQNTPMHKLTLDHLSVTEVLRLHLLASGSIPSDKDVKWRWQERGAYTSRDDPGLQLRLEEPQILKTLCHGTIFDLTISERLKVLTCIIHQINTYVNVRDIMDENFETFKTSRTTIRTIQAAQKRKEAEDTLWKQRLRADKVIPDMNSLKAGSQEEEEPANGKKKDVVLLTDEQVEAALAKKEKEIERKKAEYNAKHAELEATINKAEKKLSIFPIGRDRAFRRYWIFSSLPGLFVEYDDEDFVGECYSEPIERISNVDLDDVSFAKENFRKLQILDKEGSDKENSITIPKKANKKKSLKKEELAPSQIQPPIFGVCTGDNESCPVHCTYLPRAKWNFFWNKEQLDELIEGLSTRGVREKELKSVLDEEKEGIASLIGKCPYMKLNNQKIYPDLQAIADKRPQRGGTTTSHSQGKNHLDPNLGYPKGTAVETIMELSLRDLILESEEKIFLGGLGSLKIENRTDWRTQIECRNYNAQVDLLSWGGSKKKSLKLTDGILNTERDSNKKEEEGKVKEEESSSASTSSSRRRENDSLSINPKVKELACAILQLRQAIEPKFFKKPLGDKEDDKKKASKVKSEENVDKPKRDSAIDRWELSLMGSTSFSQLFLHFFTLDNSIEWLRSVLNARCRLCRRKGDPENMLLCDGCNKGHHSYCLKPPLQVIPKGDWYCTDCKPVEPPPKLPPRNRKMLNMNEMTDNEDEDEEEGEPGEEVCAECGYGGEVICCDSCPLLYHLNCLNPPKTRVPRGTWYCPECANPKKKKKGGKKGKTSQKKKAVKKRISSDEDSDDDEPELSDYGEHNDEESMEVTETSQETLQYGEDETGDSEDESSSESDEDDEGSETPVVRVRIDSKREKKPSPAGSGVKRSNQRRIYSDSEDGSEGGGTLGRGTKRKCALKADVKIAQAAKRLRSDSKENESTSENSNDSFNSKRKTSMEGSDDLPDFAPKRTRLQRMNTNQHFGDHSELDNVMLDRLISDLLKHSDAWPFRKPVSRSEAPDYHEMIKNPMDLGTIKYKLNSMVYSCNEEFVSDLLLVFSNCLEYNQPTSPVYKAGVDLRSYCERLCSKLGIHLGDPKNPTQPSGTS